MRRFAIHLSAFVLGLLFIHSSQAQTYRLADGNLLIGKPISFNERGLVVMQSGDIPSSRIGWTNFTEESLLELAKIPEAQEFIRPLLEPEEDEAETKVVEVKPRPVERLSRLDPNAGLGALFSSTLSLSIFLLLYAANIYAGYEIALFRNLHPLVGCGAALLLPALAPLILVCLPTRVEPAYNPAELQYEEALAEEEQVESVPVAEPAPEAEAAKPTKAPPTIYRRGTTSFNRRFFETKFAGFLRVVPGEAEQGMEIYIQSARGEHVGTRLSKVLPTELHLQIEKGGASADVTIPFNEIQEVHVRPKEEPA